MSIKITIEGATPQDLAANLAEIILRGWRDWDEDRTTSIEERAQRIVEKKLNQEVAAGVQNERVQPWKEFVTEQLVRDQYNRDKVERLARDTVDQLFKNQLKGLLDDVLDNGLRALGRVVLDRLVKQVRAQVDELVGEKIKGALRSAVGVKS